MAHSIAPWQARVGTINGWLFAAMFFFLPMHVAAPYVLTVAMAILSAVEGRFAEKWRSLRQEPLFWIFQAFFWLMVLSLLWTSDMTEGSHTIRHYGFFFLSGLYLTIARPALAARCIGFFLAGCALAEALAYYNWVQLHLFPDWPAGIRVRKDPLDTAPFVDRILYSPVLAWAGYLAAHQARRHVGLKRWGYALLCLATLGNLVFSGGRAGQLTFLVLSAVWVFQSLGKRPLLATATSALLVGTIAAASYTGNAYVKDRIDNALYELAHYDQAVNTSVGLRINFYVNSFRLFSANPLLGVGAGDFTSEYAAVNARYSPEWVPTDQPHNQYLFVLSTTGIVGGVLLLLVYFPSRPWRSDPHAQGDLRLALMVFIAVVSLFEDYIWRSNTSLLYVIFAALLHGGHREKTRTSEAMQSDHRK